MITYVLLLMALAVMAVITLRTGIRADDPITAQIFFGFSFALVSTLILLLTLGYPK